MMKVTKPIEEMSDKEVYEALANYRTSRDLVIDGPEAARNMLSLMRVVFEMKDDAEEDI